MHNRRVTILFSLLVVLTVGLIWCHSCMSREVSGEQSGFIVQILKPLLDPNGTISEEDFHHGVRKVAHFAEFAVLGLLIGGLFSGLRTKSGDAYWSLPILIVLLVAVLDEYIQFFADRGSQVTDVILDFAGGLSGLSAAVLFSILIKKN